MQVMQVMQVVQVVQVEERSDEIPRAQRIGIMQVGTRHKLKDLQDLQDRKTARQFTEGGIYRQRRPHL